MNISKKLSIIVLLTIIEVSITIGAACEIAKGATFQQLNVLHLKFNAQFSRKLVDIQNGARINPQSLTNVVTDVRQQPLDCLTLVNFLDEFIMKQIGTHYALGLCQSDIDVANSALIAIDRYAEGSIGRSALLTELQTAAEEFNANSAEFEPPIAKTVAFILKTLIPLIIFISIFNIAFITYLSRTISASIRNAIGMLQHSNSERDLGDDVEENISGELAELLTVARQRIRSDILNRELSTELELEVEKRTESLQIVNAELAEFAYRASHDLKAPLSSAKGLARFVSQDIDAGDLDEAKLNAQKICIQMEALEKLVVDILSLARADLGTDQKEPVDFKILIRDIKGRLYGQTEDASFAVIEDIEVSTPLVAEKTRLAQIIENLVSNAIKYRDAKKEKPFVIISVSDDSDSYSLTVQDNGIGIPEARRSEVFEMFKRFHPDVGAGTGLGLAIVKKHVDYLCGKIDFESSEDGTTFAVQIPK